MTVILTVMLKYAALLALGSVLMLPVLLLQRRPRGYRGTNYVGQPSRKPPPRKPPPLQAVARWDSDTTPRSK